MQTQFKMLLKEQFDLGLHYLLMDPHASVLGQYDVFSSIFFLGYSPDNLCDDYGTVLRQV